MAEKIQFLKNIELFKKLLPTNIEKIAQVMEMKAYNLGDKLITQGDAGDAFYMIQSGYDSSYCSQLGVYKVNVSAGRVTITQTQSTKTGFSSSATTKELARLGPGQSFGELALMEDAPRKATVTASSDTVQVCDQLRCIQYVLYATSKYMVVAAVLDCRPGKLHTYIR